MTITTERKAGATALRMLWLDLTRRCQLSCSHCYNSSGPDGDHGTMTRSDWLRVLDEAALIGVEQVQFIGGEPTLHPDAFQLVGRALDHNMQVEFFTNLVHVPAGWWGMFGRTGVSLATSYYSDRAAEHDAITGRPSHARTRANIERAVARGIPIRAAVIDAGDGQRVDQARRELKVMGVARVGIDRVRRFGRGAQEREPDLGELCGRCGDGRAAIGPDGQVSPCVFTAGWMRVGNVRDAPVAAILGGAALAQATGSILAATRSGVCEPDQECHPGIPPSTCRPKN